MLVNFERFKRRIKTRRYRRWLFGRFVIFLTAAGCVALIVFASTTIAAEPEPQEHTIYIEEAVPPAVETPAPRESAEPLTEPQDKPETVTEPVEAQPEEAEEEPMPEFFDVPLSEELQLHIFELCGQYGIDPAVIVAQIYRESTYNPDCIGDGGASFGLMQIQPRWHSGRMERLGCTDLLDPFQNVTVGIDYLAECFGRYGDIACALTAYNQGSYKGVVNNYARNVLATAEELEG